MAAGTIIATNYVGMARVLAASFADHHPGSPFYTLLIDGDESHRALTGIGEVVLPVDLPLLDDEWVEMAAGYSVMELATAAKPAFLQWLLATAETATYLDPDIKVYHPLTDSFAAAAASSIALTPHCLTQVPRDGFELSERAIMLAGIFNLGFISVGQRSRRFLSWWHERLRHDAIVDVQSALFADQRWVDWVPSLFEHTVLRDPGLNVAYWNAHERDVRRGHDGELYAGASLLKFFHFSGYDPETPWLLSKHASVNPRVLLPDYPVLEEICADYASDLERADHAVYQRQGYRNERLANGFLMTSRVRRLARGAYLAGGQARRDLANPYTDPDGFVDWLATPVRGTLTHPLSRWESSIWADRIDLQIAFPELDGRHASDYRLWMDNDPRTRAERAHAFPGRSAPVVEVPPAHPAGPLGWSVIAYATAELGVGEAGRRLARATAQIGLPTELVGVSNTESRQQHHTSDLRRRPSFENTITCVNADQLSHTWHQLGIAAAEHRGRRVGLWFWEVDRVPERLLPAFDLLDQIWVASEYTRDVLDRVGRCPVKLVRLPVTPPSAPTPYSREMLGLPGDPFLFLCTYDFFSVIKRKNPLDVITAYTDAFGPDDGATLVLKSINGHRRTAELAMVRHAAGRRCDIVVLDGYLSAAQMAGVIEHSDCVVSLHRSEGYGLNLADAMAMGRPVMATGYSGNMTFMDEESAFLVPFVETEVGPGSDPYPAAARWAQPDVHSSAQIMRRIFDDPAAARVRGEAGRRKILAENSIELAGARVRELTLNLLGSS